MNKKTDLRPYIVKGDKTQNINEKNELLDKMMYTTVNDIAGFVTPISEAEVPIVAATLRYVAETLLESVGDDAKTAEKSAYELMKMGLEVEKVMEERKKQE